LGKPVCDTQFLQSGVELFQRVLVFQLRSHLNQYFKLLGLAEARQDFQTEEIPLIAGNDAFPFNKSCSISRRGLCRLRGFVIWLLGLRRVAKSRRDKTAAALGCSPRTEHHHIELPHPSFHPHKPQSTFLGDHVAKE
jgi:hypothetical protein